MALQPILLGGAYDIAHHMQWFEAFAARLEGSTRTCRISFLDMYPKIAGRMAALGFVGVPEEAKAAPAVETPESTGSRIQRLKAKLAKSGNPFGKVLFNILAKDHLSESDWEDVEDTLLLADVARGQRTVG